MTDSRADLVQGTLDMLVLKTLSLEPMHGWGISLRLRDISGDVFAVNQGSLYPALQRMLTRGWVKASWRVTDNNRRARYYQLTREGERMLAEQTAEWRRSSEAVERVLRFAFQP
jgi:transcriptional regulator